MTEREKWPTLYHVQSTMSAALQQSVSDVWSLLMQRQTIVKQTKLAVMMPVCFASGKELCNGVQSMQSSCKYGTQRCQLARRVRQNLQLILILLPSYTGYYKCTACCTSASLFHMCTEGYFRGLPNNTRAQEAALRIARQLFAGYVGMLLHIWYPLAF